MTKDMMAKAVSEYFSEKGGPMDLATYKADGSNVPVKDYLLRRNFGSWNRVLSVVEKRYPVTVKAPTPTPAPKAKAAAKKAPVKKVEKKDVK
jgi:hypothetical protein